MKQLVVLGKTDYTVLVKIRDDAGAPATGLAAANIDIAYARVETDNDVTTTDVTPTDLSALTDAHTDWGVKEVSSTDHPGVYRLDIADAVFASGAWSAIVTIVGTGLDPADMEFLLVAVDPADADPPVDVIKWLGTAAATPSVAGVPEVDVTYISGDPVAASALDANDRPLVGIDATSFDTDTDGYAAVVKRTVDAAAGTPADRYSVIFKKNGLENTDAVTVPKIRVFQMDAGATALIPESALTEAGTEEAYFYNAVTTERATAGVAYTVVITATIGGSSRTWKIAVGQDTSA